MSGAVTSSLRGFASGNQGDTAVSEGSTMRRVRSRDPSSIRRRCSPRLCSNAHAVMTVVIPELSYSSASELRPRRALDCALAMRAGGCSPAHGAGGFWAMPDADTDLTRAGAARDRLCPGRCPSSGRSRLPQTARRWREPREQPASRRRPGGRVACVRAWREAGRRRHEPACRSVEGSLRRADAPIRRSEHAA